MYSFVHARANSNTHQARTPQDQFHRIDFSKPRLSHFLHPQRASHLLEGVGSVRLRKAQGLVGEQFVAHAVESGAYSDTACR